MWRLKSYSITCSRTPAEITDFEPALPIIWPHLPPPAPDRPGVGFLILHAGNGADYAVLCWWDRENELPIRIAVRQHAEATWRPAGPSESVCVWDLEVIWHEQQSYIRHVLRRSPDLDAYLRDTVTATGA